ncbi:nitrite reductase small subunit NirD [Granulosicoccaceae sp. 1_MG-2023]|nr:nitrite reductase small subunit NirD [Granulosicoccaceae sp. 1_MG-2023]
MSTNSEWISVCKESDLIEFSGVAALIGKQSVAIFYVPDLEQKVFAIDNYDPFSGANVISRGLVGDLKGKVVVASPIYKQHFELATGQSLEDENIRVGVWPVKMENGDVLIGRRSSRAVAA